MNKKKLYLETSNNGKGSSTAFVFTYLIGCVYDG